MEDLTKYWKGLSLVEKNVPAFNLEKETIEVEFIVEAKFLTKRALNTDAIATTFTGLWGSKNGFKVENLGNHIVLITFDNKLEVDNIISNEPWSFDKHLMALQHHDKCWKKLILHLIQNP
uniref:DUF4283 domain-containing protein n=1 Tax=Quercus lobata TaxID=97700 RepID=A0A7N2MUF8_QUELO